MSTMLNHLFNLPEQICYVQCGFCTTILLVSVPCGSLSMVVTVRCGHCTSLLSVNMMKVSFVPFHLLASLTQDDHHDQKEVCPAEMDAGKTLDDTQYYFPSMVTSSDNDEEDEDTNNYQPSNPVVNKPPEKRQRAPSAYNRFIKEEIRRLKAENPNMPHKTAFSTAAKNWAHFPSTHYYEEDGMSCDHQVELEKVNIEGKGFQERKAPRHSIWGKDTL